MAGLGRAVCEHSRKATMNPQVVVSIVSPAVPVVMPEHWPQSVHVPARDGSFAVNETFLTENTIALVVRPQDRYAVLYASIATDAVPITVCAI